MKHFTKDGWDAFYAEDGTGDVHLQAVGPGGGYTVPMSFLRDLVSHVSADLADPKEDERHIWQVAYAAELSRTRFRFDSRQEADRSARAFADEALDNYRNGVSRGRVP